MLEFRRLKSLLLVCIVGILTTGCEQAKFRTLTIAIDDDVADNFSETAPGLVLSDFAGGGGVVIAALCGDDFKPLEVNQVLDLSCLEEGKLGTDEDAHTWIAPAPTSWDAATICALPTPARDPQNSSFFDWVLDIRSALPADHPAHQSESSFGATEIAADLVPFADAEFAATSTGTWERPLLSTCSGSWESAVRLD